MFMLSVMFINLNSQLAVLHVKHLSIGYYFQTFLWALFHGVES